MMERGFFGKIGVETIVPALRKQPGTWPNLIRRSDMPILPHSKRCTKCGETKPLSEFHKNSRSPDGHHTWCKLCRRPKSVLERIELAEKGLKRCTLCNEVKPLGDYYNDKTHRDGKTSRCQECYAEARRKRATRPKRNVERKTCSDCGENKSVDEFHANMYSRDGYRSNCKVCARKARRRYYYSNHEAALERARENYDPAHMRRWREKNLEKARRATRNSVRRYLARKSDADGDFTESDFEKICEHYGNRCLCCESADVKLTADHVIPLSWDGSTNDIGNIQPLCKSCNSSKGDHHDTDYRPDKGKFARELAEDESHESDA